MKIESVYQFTVGDGKAYLPKLDAFRHTLKNLKPGKYALIVKKIEKKRTVPSNRLLWMWLTVIANEIGYDDPDDIKLELQEMFLREPNKKGVMVTKGTSSLNTKDFTVFLEKVERWAQEFHNITLPSPAMLGLIEE